MDEPGTNQGIVVFCLLAALGSLSLTITKRNKSMMRAQIILFLAAFAIRFATGIVLYVFDFSSVVGDEDAGSWHMGAYIMDEWLAAGVNLFQLPGVMLEMFDTHNRGYRYLLAAFFYLTNSPYRLVASTLNCFFGAMTVVLVFRAARTLFNDRIAIRTAWLSSLMPSLVLWSALTVKEPIVIFLETLALYGCVRLMQDSFSTRHLSICAVAVVFLLPLRFYATAIVGGTVLMSLLLPGLLKLRTSLAALALAALIIPGVMGAGSIAKHEQEIQRFDVERIEKIRGKFSTGEGSGSAVKMKYDMSTPYGFTMATLVGGAHFLLAPFPWQMMQGGSTRMLLTAPELLVWWWLFFTGTIAGLWYCIRNRMVQITPVMLHLAGFGLLYSLIFSNIGLVYRQRAQLLPWFLLLAMVGLEFRHQRNLARRRAAMASASATVAGSAGIPVREAGHARAF